MTGGGPSSGASRAGGIASRRASAPAASRRCTSAECMHWYTAPLVRVRARVRVRVRVRVSS